VIRLRHPGLFSRAAGISAALFFCPKMDGSWSDFLFVYFRGLTINTTMWHFRGLIRSALPTHPKTKALKFYETSVRVLPLNKMASGDQPSQTFWLPPFPCGGVSDLRGAIGGKTGNQEMRE
jgi:hypothetical protein